MKNRLHILLVITLLILCTACGTANTADTTPDTPPDNTGDDMRDLFSPYTIDIPSQPDETVKRANATKPDDTTKPDTPQIPNPNYPNDLNTTALQAYYGFLAGGTTAYCRSLNQDITFAQDIDKLGSAPVAKFALVDFGLDGILEVVLEHTNSAYSNVILSYVNGKVYVDFVVYRAMGMLTYNGVVFLSHNTPEGAVAAYTIMTVSVQNGVETDTLGYTDYVSATDSYTYYLNCELNNGQLTNREKSEVTKDEYNALFDELYSLYTLQWHTFSIGKIQEVFLGLK